MPALSVARRLVHLLALLAPAWASLVFFTDGLSFALGPVRFASTEPVRPLLVGLAAAAYYLWRYDSNDREADGRFLVRVLNRALPWSVALIVFLGFAPLGYRPLGTDGTIVPSPPDAVILAVQHSGSVRHYANRITLQYDALRGNNLDVIMRDLTALGRPSFVVLDDWEEAEFRDRFASNSRAGRLNWTPLARVAGHPEVRIYDLEGRGE